MDKKTVAEESAGLVPGAETGSETGSETGAGSSDGGRVGRRREVFWQNVVRETLNALSVAAAMYSGRLSADAKGASASGAPAHELFDGRMAVMTRLGQRIPIADVYPVFACSVPSVSPGSGSGDRMLSADVQCTVFQIRTPTGEVYTLPVHEIVSVHALSEALMRQLQVAAAEASEDGPGKASGEPFGFAAYTSLARSEAESQGE